MRECKEELYICWVGGLADRDIEPGQEPPVDRLGNGYHPTGIPLSIDVDISSRTARGRDVGARDKHGLGYRRPICPCEGTGGLYVKILTWVQDNSIGRLSPSLDTNLLGRPHTARVAAGLDYSTFL